MKEFNWKNNIVTHMHIEITNYCNAKCPLCPRYVDTSPIVRPEIILNQITIEQFKNWFPPEFIKNIIRIMFCGTHGDPALSKDLLKICKYIRKENDNCSIQIHSNGGARTTNFWRELAKIINTGFWKHCVIFGIDGLEDTNHLYRRGVNWNKLIENVKSYIDAGGRAEWDFLTFKHNQHQIDIAENLSKELGFSGFNKKRALGFEHNDILRDRHVYDKNGNYVYSLEPPDDKSLINSRVKDKIKQSIKLIKDFSYLKNYKKGYNPDVESKLKDFDNTKIPNYATYYDNHIINCKSSTEYGTSEIYINSNGIVFPCCYVGTRYDSAIDLYEDTQLRHVIRKEGIDNFDLNKISIQKIISENHLDKVFTDSWKKQKISEGKLCYCAMTCGQNSQLDNIYVNDPYRCKQ